jgi:hypothetical protein
VPARFAGPGPGDRLRVGEVTVSEVGGPRHLADLASIVVPAAPPTGGGGVSWAGNGPLFVIHYALLLRWTKVWLGSR